MAKELIAEAIDLRDDRYLSALANAREAETTEWISHEDFWEQALKSSKKNV